ncbi:Molybdopterin molybdenumtransferase [Pelotomaculum sp. FP]|uniref:molybdopterin molybdotransferase MoeA n=1 Tax=Pelotomaculum sp. FP TaxID=261474 RepID=UPI001066654C|nr:molybdopterin molybdotransferase MoeA [Pelotomaculum sp. FP]TEB15799.1 Molybdopterin molybdenumtransferase [Pelotomaculum sp. FP]
MLRNVKLEEAQDILLSLTAPLPGETVPLLQALGRVAARDLYADQSLPPCPQAVVDGYAVCAGVNSCGGGGYVVKERLSPGKTATSPLSSGQAAYVATGCALPAGTTAVVPHEIARLSGERVVFTEEVLQGDNIREPGEDFQAGSLLVSRGTRLSPGLTSVLAAFGKNNVTVFRRPKVAVLSLGGGVVSYHNIPEPGQLRDSNGPLIAALALEDGGQVTNVEVSGGESAACLKEHLENLMQQADLVITTGGAASGDDDQATYMLKNIGAYLLFWGIKIKPGSHSGAAIVNNKIIIALSGNPAACAAGYHLLAGPVLRALQELPPYPKVLSATCTNSFHKEGGPRRFLQGYAVCDDKGWSVTILPGQKSSMLQALTKSNALIDLPAGSPPVEKDQEVSIILLYS